MRHRIASRKLGRTSSHRMAMLRNMATSLLAHERIHTTDSKAKELRKIAEQMISLGKRGDLHSRRQAGAVLRTSQVTRKLFSELADRYREVSGGYTRIVKVGPRRGDGAMTSLIELVKPEKGAAGGRKRGTKKAPARRRESRAARGKKTAGEDTAGSRQG
jgi:large subunit ribosomal protein L17